MTIVEALTFAVSLLTFLNGVCLARTNQEAKSVIDRDIAQYDKAGPYTTYPFDRKEDRESEMRDFLWRHYTCQRRGYLLVTRHTTEGEPFTYHVFIEPDRNGVWRFRVTVDGIKAAGPYVGPNSPVDRIHWEYETCAVVREDPPSGEVQLSDVRSREERSPRTHRLILKYCGGGEVVF